MWRDRGKQEGTGEILGDHCKRRLPGTVAIIETKRLGYMRQRGTGRLRLETAGTGRDWAGCGETEGNRRRLQGLVGCRARLSRTGKETGETQRDHCKCGETAV